MDFLFYLSNIVNLVLSFETHHSEFCEHFVETDIECADLICDKVTVRKAHCNTQGRADVELCLESNCPQSTVVISY